MPTASELAAAEAGLRASSAGSLPAEAGLRASSAGSLPAAAPAGDLAYVTASLSAPAAAAVAGTPAPSGIVSGGGGAAAEEAAPRSASLGSSPRPGGSAHSSASGAGVAEAVGRARLESTLPLLVAGSHIAVRNGNPKP